MLSPFIFGDPKGTRTPVAGVRGRTGYYLSVVY